MQNFSNFVTENQMNQSTNTKRFRSISASSLSSSGSSSSPFDSLPFKLDEPHISVEEIESILNFDKSGKGQRVKINNPFFYRKAFMHKSMRGIVKKASRENIRVLDYMRESNERLEFLGDSVFSAAITTWLFQKYRGKDEGNLTKIRTRIVKGTTMTDFAKKLGLGKYVFFNPKIAKFYSNHKVNSRLLEDVFESFMGAIKLDLGYDHAEKFAFSILNKYMDPDFLLKDDNFKDKLIRYSQAMKISPPIFECVEVGGVAHSRTFTVEVKFVGKVWGRSTQNTKKKAEQECSRIVLDLFKITEGEIRKLQEENAAAKASNSSETKAKF